MSTSVNGLINSGPDTIEQAIETIRNGGLAVVMDNEDRENEGDLIGAAEFVTPQAMAFLIRHSTGIVCAPALPDRLEALQLPLMVNDENNGETHQCQFTVTVDLRPGNTSGVSAADRARTIKALADPSTNPSDLNRPGHVFPLKAQPGGVLTRSGHTEAAVDLAKLAGAAPVGYICEINDDDGVMMRRPQLQQFAREHHLPLITISDLIRYRVRTESLIQRVKSTSKAATPLGTFTSAHYDTSLGDSGITFEAFVYGDVHRDNVPLFISNETDGCKGQTQVFVQAQWAQQTITQHGHGILLFAQGSKRMTALSGELMAAQSLFGLATQVAKDLGAQSLQLLHADEAVSFGTDGFALDVASSQQLQKTH